MKFRPSCTRFLMTGIAGSGTPSLRIFAIACFNARADDIGKVALTPRNFLRLKDRLERLSVTRWQWFSMVLVVILVRLQHGVPLMVELTVAAQFMIFLALPVQKQKTHRRRQFLRRRCESIAWASARSTLSKSRVR